jgi:hypothetical protein
MMMTQCDIIKIYQSHPNQHLEIFSEMKSNTSITKTPTTINCIKLPSIDIDLPTEFESFSIPSQRPTISIKYCLDLPSCYKCCHNNYNLITFLALLIHSTIIYQH